MNRSLSNNNEYYFSSPTFLNNQSNPLFDPSGGGYAPRPSATEAPFAQNYFSAQLGNASVEHQKTRNSVTSEKNANNPQVLNNCKTKKINNHELNTSNHMDFKTQIPAFYPGQPYIYSYPYPQPHLFSMSDYIHMDATQNNAISTNSETPYSYPFGFVPVQAAPPLNWRPPTRKSVGYQGNCYSNHQFNQNAEVYSMYANPYMSPEGHSMFMNELKERASKGSKNKKTIDEELKEPLLPQNDSINGNRPSHLEFDEENANADEDDEGLKVLYPQELFGIDHTYSPKTKFSQNDFQMGTIGHYNNPFEDYYYKEMLPPQFPNQVVVDNGTFIANPFVPTPSNMNNLFCPIFNNSPTSKTRVKNVQEANNEYQDFAAKLDSSNRKSVLNEEPMFSTIKQQDEFKVNKTDAIFNLEDEIPKRGDHHKMASSLKNMEYFFDGTIQPQELIIGEQLLNKNEIDEISGIHYNEMSKNLTDNMKFENPSVFGETKTGFESIEPDVDLDIDVEYELPYINRSDLSALPNAVFQSPQTATIDHINSRVIQEKRLTNKRSSKKETTTHQKDKPKKIKNFKRENRPTPILLDNSDVNTDIMYKDVLESSVMTGIGSQNEPMVAPQFLEDTSTLDSYSVLTKSTIRAVEQIKNDVMNNKNSKLAFFSPVIDSQHKQPKSTVNTSTYNKLTNFNISSPMSNNSIDSGLMSALNSSSHTGKHRMLPQINETPLTCTYESYGEAKKAQLSSSSAGCGKSASTRLSARKSSNSYSKGSSVTRALTATVDAVLKKNTTLPDLVKRKKLTSNFGQSSDTSSSKFLATKKKVKKPTSADTGKSSTSLSSATTPSSKVKLEFSKGSEITRSSTLTKNDVNVTQEKDFEDVEYNETTKENEILETLKNIFLNKEKTTRRSAARKHTGAKTLAFQIPDENASDAEIKFESNQTKKLKSDAWDVEGNEDEYLEEEEEEDMIMDDDGKANNSNPDVSITAKKSSLVSQMLNDEVLLNEDLKKPKRGFYKCLHCNETYSTVLDYAKHLDDAKIVRPFKCPFHTCPWKYLGLTKRSELRRHCAIQHKDELTTEMMELLNLNNDNFPVLHCENKFCDKKFYRRDSHQRHVQMVHMNPKSRFNKRVEKFRKQCSSTNEEEIDDFIRARLTK